MLAVITRLRAFHGIGPRLLPVWSVMGLVEERNAGNVSFNLTSFFTFLDVLFRRFHESANMLASKSEFKVVIRKWCM